MSFPETEIHGACNHSGVSVRVIEGSVAGIPSRVRVALDRRRVVGEKKYGSGLTGGWEHSDTALLQELLDGIEYALVGGRVWFARVLAIMAWTILRKLESK
jgi:hypothetical protein